MSRSRRARFGGVVVGLVAALGVLTGCASSPAGAPPAEEAAVDIDPCEAPEPVACCKALTPECDACHAASAARHAEWEARCPDALDPLPAVHDCGQPPALTPCCRALLPRCTDCAARNREIEAAWRAACEEEDP